MKKLLIISTLLTTPISAETPNLEAIKKEPNKNNKIEAEKTALPYVNKIKDTEGRYINGFKVIVSPECAQYLTGYFVGAGIAGASTLGLKLIPNEYQSIGLFTCFFLNVASLKGLWHPKCKTGPYLAAGATTSALLIAVIAIGLAITQ